MLEIDPDRGWVIMKTHLRQSSGNYYPACHIVGHGKVNAPFGVAPQSFKNEHEDFRRKKCEAVFLKRRNAQRKKAGKQPITAFNE